jgi:hypothetical protein
VLIKDGYTKISSDLKFLNMVIPLNVGVTYKCFSCYAIQMSG